MKHIIIRLTVKQWLCLRISEKKMNVGARAITLWAEYLPCMQLILD